VGQAPTEWCYNLPTTLASLSQSSGSGYIDTIQLPATGTYTILVDPYGAATGSMTVTLNNVPADFAATTTPGAGPVTVNIGTPGQNGQVSFSGTAGQRISLQTTGMSISGGWVKIQQSPALLPFTAGQQYSIEMQYYQGSGGSVARLRWSSPSTQKQIIPQTQLTPAGGTAGTGLKGEYYSNTSLTGTPTLTRTDATVNFDWRGSTPGGAVPTTNWSARWTDPDTQRLLYPPLAKSELH